MAKVKVWVELSASQEISLQERYGRGCSRETLVDRAIAEVITLTTPWVKPVREKRDKKEPPADPTLGFDDSLHKESEAVNA